MVIQACQRRLHYKIPDFSFGSDQLNSFARFCRWLGWVCRQNSTWIAHSAGVTPAGFKHYLYIRPPERKFRGDNTALLDVAMWMEDALGIEVTWEDLYTLTTTRDDSWKPLAKRAIASLSGSSTDATGEGKP